MCRKYVSMNWISIGSDNDLSPIRRRAIVRTNAGIFFIWPLATKFSEMLIKIHTFVFKKTYLKMSSAKWRPFCPGLNMLRRHHCTKHGIPIIRTAFIFFQSKAMTISWQRQTLDVKIDALRFKWCRFKHQFVASRGSMCLDMIDSIISWHRWGFVKRLSVALPTTDYLDSSGFIGEDFASILYG